MNAVVAGFYVVISVFGQEYTAVGPEPTYNRCIQLQMTLQVEGRDRYDKGERRIVFGKTVTPNDVTLKCEKRG